MDITRLPFAPYARPVTTPVNASLRAAPGGAVESVSAAGSEARLGRERPARVVQGELLDRQRDSYQSTRAFVNERNLDQSRPADEPGVSALQSRSALFRYANNMRPESIADLTRGRSVNFFI